VDEAALPSGEMGPVDFWAFAAIGVDLGLGGHGFVLANS